MRVHDEVRSPSGERFRAAGDALLESSFADLADDFDELAHIARSARDRLSVALGELERARPFLQPSTKVALAEQAQAEAGLAQIHQGLAVHQETGAKLTRPRSS